MPIPAQSRRRGVAWWAWVVLVAVLLPLLVGLLLWATGRPQYLVNIVGRRTVSALALPPSGSRVLLLAAHPSDEILATGGLLQQLLASDCEVYVVLLTNGDGPALSPAPGEDTRLRTPDEHLDLGRLRLRESLRVLEGLGLPPERFISLGYPTGGLHRLWGPSHWLPGTPLTSSHTRVYRNPYSTSRSPNAPYAGLLLLRELSDLLHQLRPQALFAPSPWDLEPDRWATWNFARLAAAETGWDRQPASTLSAYLIRQADWPPPGAHPRLALEPPETLVHLLSLRWRALPVSPDELQAKTQALAQYETRLPARAPFHASFLRANELFASVEERPLRGRALTLACPVGDSPYLRATRAADVTALEVIPGEREWAVTLTLAAPPDPALTYTVLGHSLTPRGTDAWEAALQGSAALLTRAFREVLAPQPLTASAQGTAVTFRLPARLFESPPVWIEGLTRRGTVILDHTAPLQLHPADLMDR